MAECSFLINSYSFWSHHLGGRRIHFHTTCDLLYTGEQCYDYLCRAQDKKLAFSQTIWSPVNKDSWTTYGNPWREIEWLRRILMKRREHLDSLDYQMFPFSSDFLCVLSSCLILHRTVDWSLSARFKCVLCFLNILCVRLAFWRAPYCFYSGVRTTSRWVFWDCLNSSAPYGDDDLQHSLTIHDSISIQDQIKGKWAQVSFQSWTGRQRPHSN